MSEETYRPAYRSFELGKPRAAVGTFPYPHRTVAEIEAERERLRWNESVRRGKRS